MSSDLLITCVYGKQSSTIKIPQNATLIDVFNIVKEQFQMAGDKSLYTLYANSEFPIDNRSASSCFGPQKPKFLFLAKSDMVKLNNTMNNILPSIVYETTRLTPAAKSFVIGLQTAINTFENYSDDETLANILSIIPFELIEGLDDEARVVAITRWFKEDFFHWTKNCRCHCCGSDETKLLNATLPTYEESKWGVSKTELHKCTICGAITRFPRINSVSKLLETRTGRCGEYANAFTAILRALGFTVRYVRDWTDHAWTEYWSEQKQRFVHIDSCENIIDKPMTYESGWGKKLKWIVAVGEHECVDVTRRYTANYDEVVERRKLEINEGWVQKYIAFKNEQMMSNISEEERNEIIKRQQLDNESMKQKRELSSEEQRGRISGNE
ncbi:peptide-N(4)-(N-acetyl-beta-glucosaminyl)asparagine amidase isoform X2 [Histomonas meleagridis]|uniref:peptide-N(4)-(N-acetyl-beta- glucosaminyl)asparagine amidase isoform X2 n=1 Tax=Histomonas meleagridis TaxID=135588 RepID=UPI00355A6179|nr:peptide-N(4)-(N-acetyl-beta-glucosaminyl)asparagine amidase isoform X2 [Histomonas meleagridis]KAH0805293.1 peptide-N(4)-(N-acetyl-beta-glucosaminyl)asparagine amidase isoform X2 [Histomonas meleagridis]